MYTEHYTNGDIRVTFRDKESFWAFIEVATFKEDPWEVRIRDKNRYHLAADFPETKKEYYMEEAVNILIGHGHDEDDARVIAEAMRDCFVE